MLDVTSRLIPFLSHNDCIRDQMASVQTKQAVALMYSESPFIRSGFEEQYLDYSSYLYLAKDDGNVIYKDNKVMICKYNNTQGGEVIYLGWEVANQDGFDKRLLTDLQVGSTFEKDDVLARHITISNDGFLQLGKNLLTTYISDPYNFKDALVISESCAEKMSIKFIHENILQFEDTIPVLMFDDNISLPQGTYVQKADPIFTIKPRNPQTPSHLVHSGSIIRTPVNGYLYYDLIVDEIVKTKKEEHFYESQYRQEVERQKTIAKHINNLYPAEEENGINLYADALCRFHCPHLYSKRTGKCIILKYWIVQVLPVQKGSKLSNRHGNKGVVSDIRLNSDMPHTPEGEPFDVIVNPLSVTSRKNVGQLFEVHLNRAMKKTFANCKNMESLNDVKSTLTNFYSMCMPEGLVNIFNQSFNEKIWNNMISQNGFQIIQPPFYNFTYENLLKVCKSTNMPDNLKEHVTIKNESIEAAVGHGYWYRLEHEPHKKLFGRSVGQYSIMGQPGRGSSAHKCGEMEVWGLLAHQAYETLIEFFVPKSDNMSEAARMMKYLHDGCSNMYTPHDLNPGILKVFRCILNATGYDLQQNKNKKV